MPSSAISSFGVVLARDDNTVAELTRIGPPSEARETVETTSHQSASQAREYLAGLYDGGEVSVAGNFIAGNTNGQIGLRSDLVAGTLQSFVITFPASITATYTFSAIVTAFKVDDMEVSGKASFTATFKISGLPVLAITASNNITVLALAGGTFYPAFAQAVYEYSVAVGAATTTFTATFAAGVCHLYKAGVFVEALTTTVDSSAQSLGEVLDRTEFELRVTETGKVTKIYYVTVHRTA